MILLLQIIFWISALALVHSYVIYPYLLSTWAAQRPPNQVVYEQDQEAWPTVAVIMSLYNEERVIEEKLQALLAISYPANKLFFYIGSDCSEDQTNAIVERYAQQHATVQFFGFRQRRGKPGVVNELVARATADFAEAGELVLVVTDANVMPHPQAFRHLIKHFKNKEIEVVDANMVHTGMEKDRGISQSEDTYISREVWLKHWEGKLWGQMIGPFGGCYAIRASAFTPVPDNYLVDDFFITLKVLEKGGKAINEMEAICYEAVSHEIAEEYRRKRRISAGNFQNMHTFRHLWWPPTTTLGYAFFSHKILRWLGPVFILLIFLSSVLLSLLGSSFYQYISLLLIGGMIGVPLLDILLRRVNVNILAFRNIRYFLIMNMALLEGLFNYLKGIKTNVWQPPKRVN
ncbi:MAG: glycosyltransferase [Bacteroidota bacterium]